MGNYKIEDVVEMPNARNTFDLTRGRVAQFQEAVQNFLKIPMVVDAFRFDFQEGLWVPDHEYSYSDGRKTNSINKTETGLTFSGGQLGNEFEVSYLGDGKFAFLRHKEYPTIRGLYLASGNHEVGHRGLQWFVRNEKIFYLNKRIEE